MPYTLAVALTKGGTAKTTTAANLAGELARTGLAVLVVDCDTQGQAARALGLDARDRGPGLAGVVAGTAGAADAVRTARAADGSGTGRSRSAAGVFLLPGGPDLASSALAMGADPAAGLLAVRDAANASAEAVGAAVVILDTPPGWGPLSLGALAAADAVLAPVPPHPLAVDALATFDGHLAGVQRARAAFGGEARPRLAFILPTLYDRRGNAPADVLDALAGWAERHRDRPAVLAPVPLTVRVQEASAFGALVSEHAPAHPASSTYRAAALAVADDVRRHA